MPPQLSTSQKLTSTSNSERAATAPKLCQLRRWRQTPCQATISVQAYHSSRALVNRPRTSRLTVSGLLWLAAWKDGHDRVCLRIEDSGSGLTPDQVLHLFEPIAPSGSGKRQTGLAISRAIVHSHGGRLWGEAADHGIFKLVLPIQETPPP